MSDPSLSSLLSVLGSQSLSSVSLLKALLVILRLTRRRRSDLCDHLFLKSMSKSFSVLVVLVSISELVWELMDSSAEDMSVLNISLSLLEWHVLVGGLHSVL